MSPKASWRLNAVRRSRKTSSISPCCEVIRVREVIMGFMSMWSRPPKDASMRAKARSRLFASPSSVFGCGILTVISTSASWVSSPSPKICLFDIGRCEPPPPCRSLYAARRCRGYGLSSPSASGILRGRRPLGEIPPPARVRAAMRCVLGGGGVLPPKRAFPRGDVIRTEPSPRLRVVLPWLFLWHFLSSLDEKMLLRIVMVARLRQPLPRATPCRHKLHDVLRLHPRSLFAFTVKPTVRLHIKVFPCPVVGKINRLLHPAQRLKRHPGVESCAFSGFVIVVSHANGLPCPFSPAAAEMTSAIFVEGCSRVAADCCAAGFPLVLGAPAKLCIIWGETGRKSRLGSATSSGYSRKAIRKASPTSTILPWRASC